MVELAKTYPMPIHVLVLRYLMTLFLRTATVCGALFMVMLVIGLAVEEGALGLESDVADGIDTFMRMFVGLVGLGGGFGVLILAAVVHDMYRREQRNTLNALVDDGTATKDQPPVDWQRTALSESRTGSWILCAFGVVLGPIALIAGIITFDSGDAGFSVGILSVAIVMTGVSALGIRSLLRPKPSSAAALWEGVEPPLHPREPKPGTDSDGNPETIGRREAANTARARAKLEAAPPQLLRLDWLDRMAARVMGASGWLLGLCATVVVAMVMLRQPCRRCEPRSFGSGVEGFIDVVLLGGVVLLVVGLVLLVAATILQAWVTLRLRGTVEAMAADPASEGPPWFLLRRLLLEESPLEALTGHLHTLGVACLAFGLTGALVGEVYPFDAWAAFYPALSTVGGVLLLFHLSGWFWKRETTRQKNQALLARWPK